MSLPDAWVDQIFEKLTLVYGVDFMNRWKGLQPSEVKADWAHELARFAQRPAAIAFALQNLPAGKPPTVLEFREIARRVPPPTNQHLFGPPPNPDRVRQELARMAELRMRNPGDGDPRAWARRVVAKHEAGQRVSAVALRMAQQALRQPATADV